MQRRNFFAAISGALFGGLLAKKATADLTFKGPHTKRFSHPNWSDAYKVPPDNDTEGVLIYYYPSGNEGVKEEVTQIAEMQYRNRGQDWLILPTTEPTVSVECVPYEEGWAILGTNLHRSTKSG